MLKEELLVECPLGDCESDTKAVFTCNQGWYQMSMPTSVCAVDIITLDVLKF